MIPAAKQGWETKGMMSTPQESVLQVDPRCTVIIKGRKKEEQWREQKKSCPRVLICLVYLYPNVPMLLLSLGNLKRTVYLCLLSPFFEHNNISNKETVRTKRDLVSNGLLF